MRSHRNRLDTGCGATPLGPAIRCRHRRLRSRLSLAEAELDAQAVLVAEGESARMLLEEELSRCHSKIAKLSVRDTAADCRSKQRASKSTQTKEFQLTLAAFLKMSASVRAHIPHVTQHPPRMKMLSATPVWTSAQYLSEYLSGRTLLHLSGNLWYLMSRLEDLTSSFGEARSSVWLLLHDRVLPTE